MIERDFNVGHGFVFDLQFNHDQWQFWAGMIGLLAIVMVVPIIDLSQSWVVVAWLTLFIVQIVQIVQKVVAGLRGPSVTGVYYGRDYRLRFEDGSAEACTVVCLVMQPIGFLLRLRTVSAKQYTVPVLKAYTDPCAYRRASVWLRFYPK